MKINFALHQHDTERTHEKQRGIVGIDSCFAFIVRSSSIRRYRQREKRCWKITCSSTLWFKRSHSRYLTLTNFRDTHRITPSSHQLTLGPLYSCTLGYTCEFSAVFCSQNLICLLLMFADQVFIDPTFLCLWLRLLSHAKRQFWEKKRLFCSLYTPRFSQGNCSITTQQARTNQVNKFKC